MGFAAGLDVGSEKGSNQEGIQGFRPREPEMEIQLTVGGKNWLISFSHGSSGKFIFLKQGLKS